MATGLALVPVVCQLALLVPSVATGVPPSWLPGDFREWAAEHGKRYETDDAWRQAFANFEASAKIINELNNDPDDEAEYGHTRFSDLSPSEFRARYLPVSRDPAEGRRGGIEELPAKTPLTPPSAFDWRDHGAVTAVKDQSVCGSCWAESAVGSIESQWYLANNATMKAPVQLSVQQVIECDAHDNACYGGWPKGAYEYAIEHGGLATEDDYPYNVSGYTICLANQTFNATCGDGMCDDPPLTSWCDQTCSDKAHKSVAHISSWTTLPKDEDQMAVALAERGPVSVGIDASGGGLGILFPWLQFYKRGVANPRRCTTQVDHGVLIVGYGEDDGSKYWTIKNSWGAKWGEAGYFRLLRGQAKCAVDTLATIANVGKEGARPQTEEIVV